jgi:hypothetical protein
LDIVSKLFHDWSLETWANVLEVIGFVVATAGLTIGLFIKSEINRLKTNYIFDTRIKKHILNLKNSTSALNQSLNDYDNNRQAIRTELGIIVSELEDLTQKIGYWQGCKSKRLISFLKTRRKKPFDIKPNANRSLLILYVSKYFYRIYKTTYDDVWIVYDRLHEIIRQMENIKQNRDKSL